MILGNVVDEMKREEKRVELRKKESKHTLAHCFP